MARKISEEILDPPDATLVDLLDRLLDKGVMANGDVTLGIAGIDLIYVRVSALLCAADRLMPVGDRSPYRRRVKGPVSGTRRSRR